MSFLDHIRACNNFEPARALPLFAGDDRIGLVRRDNAEALRRFPDVFTVEQDRVKLQGHGDVAATSAAVDGVVDALLAENRVPKWRNETFDVAPRWGAPPVFRLDRGAVPFFGTRAYGVHLNGYRRERGGIYLWIGRRAPDKKVAPDKLDNIVAGGIGNGHGVEETLLKEGEEEASLPKSLTQRAVSVGAVSYRMETDLGIRDDVLFVYDLEIPADCVPQNQDGEIVRFELMSAADVLERVRTTQDFKFNVNLVMLDFAVRHGVLRPSDPEYLDAATGLHRPLDWGETPPTSTH
jgi:8-oxo-dGTP pyrophosphatase MutT (NUDIX family)